MDSHQVIGLAPGFGEFLLEKLIKGLQSVYPPTISGPHFTQVTPKFDEADGTLPILGSFELQGVFGLSQDERGATVIQTRYHQWPQPMQSGDALVTWAGISKSEKPVLYHPAHRWKLD